MRVPSAEVTVSMLASVWKLVLQLGPLLTDRLIGRSLRPWPVSTTVTAASAEILRVIARPLGKGAGRFARDVFHSRRDDLGCFDETRPGVEGSVGHTHDLVFRVLSRELFPAERSSDCVADRVDLLDLSQRLRPGQDIACAG